MAKKIINFLEELEEKNFDIDTQLEPLKKEIKKTLVKDGTMKKDEKITDESFSTYYFYYKNKYINRFIIHKIIKIRKNEVFIKFFYP